MNTRAQSGSNIQHQSLSDACHTFMGMASGSSLQHKHLPYPLLERANGLHIIQLHAPSPRRAQVFI